MSYDYGNGEYDTDDYEYQQDLASGMIVLDGSLEARERALWAEEKREEIIDELMDADREELRELWLEDPANAEAVEQELAYAMEEWM